MNSFQNQCQNNFTWSLKKCFWRTDPGLWVDLGPFCRRHRSWRLGVNLIWQWVTFSNPQEPVLHLKDNLSTLNWTSIEPNQLGEIVSQADTDHQSESKKWMSRKNRDLCKTLLQKLKNSETHRSKNKTELKLHELTQNSSQKQFKLTEKFCVWTTN